jgi:putative tricarboxylic transport membrane protein
MRLNDRLSGLLVLIAGAAIAGYAQTFPPMPGQPVGPSLFPTVIGCALVALGAALTFAGVRTADRWWIAFDAWARRPRMVFNFALVVGTVLLYAVVVDRLGFILTAAGLLSVLFLAFGVRPGRIVPMALVVTFVIHYAFYTVLRVPLPWGVLEGIAW